MKHTVILQPGEDRPSPFSAHRPDEPVTDADTALRYLRDGNQRYLQHRTLPPQTDPEQWKQLALNPQYPFAVVITCADSRVLPELFFDLRMGDIFVVRHPGNTADRTTLGAVEYGVACLSVPLVVVVGHSRCGAVTAAFHGGEYPEHLQEILNSIHTNINGQPNLDCAIHSNVACTVAQIRRNAVVQKAGTRVVGAYFDIATGVVTWSEGAPL